MTSRLVILAVALMLAVPRIGAGQSVSSRQTTGRALTAVLAELSRQGLALVYSSRVVRPDMVVHTAPTARSARAVLDEVLAQHGLRVETGPKGRLLIVAAGGARPSPGLARPRGPVTGAVNVAFCRQGTGERIPVSRVDLRSDEGVATVRPDGSVTIDGLADGPRYVEAIVSGFPPLPLKPAAVRVGRPVEIVFDLANEPGSSRPAGAAAVAVTLVLTRGVDYLEVVQVSGRPGQDGAAGQAAVMTAADLLQGAGHAGNLLSALQTMPAVKAGRDFDSRLVVRGGAPDQNLVLIDGVEIHSPTHLFGLASTILPAAVESVELSAGGFDARHGDRLSSVLSVRSRSDHDGGPTGGTIGVGLLESDLLLAGRAPALGGASWFVAGRHSFYDVTAGALLDIGLPAFSDGHAKASWDRWVGRRLWVQALASRERTDYRQRDDPGEDWRMDTRSRTTVASIGFEATAPGGSSWRTVASVYDLQDRFGIEGLLATDARAALGEQRADGRLAAVDFGRTVAVRDLAVRQDVTVFASSRHSLDLGFQFHRLQTRWQWQVSGDRSEGLTNQSIPWPYGVPGASLPSWLDSALGYSRTGGWVHYRVAPHARLTVTAGFRADRSGLTSELAASPRASVAVRLDNRTRLSASLGLFRQSPGYEKQFQADAFVDLGSARGGLRSERASHAMVRMEHDLSPGVAARVEVYRKRYADLVVGRLETENERRDRLARYDFGALSAEVPTDARVTAVPANAARGLAYGVEAYLSKSVSSGDPRLTGWLSYSFAVARRNAYGVLVPFDYDRRHVISLVGQYRVRPTVAFSGTVRLASGSPWTPPVGVRVAATADRGDTDGDGNRDEWIPARDSTGALIYTHDYGGPANVNSARLPAFARVDVRVTVSPGSPRGNWTFYVDAMNLLNRTNAGLITCRVTGTVGAVPIIERRPELGLPFLPSFGLRYRF